MRALALAAGLLAAPALAAAQARSVALVVTDASAAFVADLRAEEVQVLENGERREVLGFARDDRPLSLALVVDTSTGATRVFRGPSMDAITTLLSRLPAGSRSTLWSTGDHPRKIGELKGERPDVEKKVAQAFAVDGPNALLDALVEAAEALGRDSGRRRALVAVSGAGAGHTNFSPSDVSTRVRRAAAPVLGLMYREGASGTTGPLAGLSAPRDAANLTVIGSSDHERILSGLAASTGGRFDSVGTAQAAGHALEAMAGELGGQYRVSYASQSQGPKRIEVRLARAGVRWRVTVDAP